MLGFLLLASLALPQGSPVPTEPAYDLGESAKLNVLFAGFPGGPREAAFVEFLSSAFQQVESVDLRDLDNELAARFDVVVADWRPSYLGGKWNQEGRCPVTLPVGFEAPTLMIGDLAGALPTGTKFTHL